MLKIVREKIFPKLELTVILIYFGHVGIDLYGPLVLTFSRTMRSFYPVE